MHTKVGTWVHLTILEGALTFYELIEEEMFSRTPLYEESDSIQIEPPTWHRVSPASDDLKCYLTFIALLKTTLPKNTRPHAYAFGN